MTVQYSYKFMPVNIVSFPYLRHGSLLSLILSPLVQLNIDVDDLKITTNNLEIITCNSTISIHKFSIKLEDAVVAMDKNIF